MAKATLKERMQKSIRLKSGSTLRRFVDGPVRTTDAVKRTVRQDSVNVDARTLTAFAATGNSRILDVFDDDLKTWLQVEEVIDIAGMDFSRVESGMHFLDNHRTDDRIYNLGSVEAARLEDVDGASSVVVDVKISARAELDSLLVDLAGGQLGCISCQYTADETTLELRDGKLPLDETGAGTTRRVGICARLAEVKGHKLFHGEATLDEAIAALAALTIVVR